MKRLIVIFAAIAAVLAVVLVVTQRRSEPEITFIPVTDADTTLAMDIPPGDEAEPGGPSGRWRPARVAAGVFSAGDEERLDKLQALPYLQGYKAAPAEQNVTIHDPELAYQAYNLCNSGHAPTAFLMDMDGEVKHTWSFEHTQAFPNVEPRLSTAYFRRVHLLDDGRLLLVFDDVGVVCIDSHSKMVWAELARFHHDLDVAADGRIYLIRHKREAVERRGMVRASIPDDIVVMSPQGRILSQHSLLACLRDSRYAGMLDAIDEISINIPDIFHTNSIRVLDGSLTDISPYFKKGNVLVSLLRLDAVVIVDPGRNKVVWASTGREHGMWRQQHDPTLLPGGRMLLFDNRGHNGRSKVVEFDPLTKEVFWQFADGNGNEFFSMTCGAATRLPNGNTLISESDNGRAFEVTREGAIVWEFLNPHRAGENGELIATLFEVQRIDGSELGWLDGAAEPTPEAEGR